MPVKKRIFFFEEQKSIKRFFFLWFIGRAYFSDWLRQMGLQIVVASETKSILNRFQDWGKLSFLGSLMLASIWFVSRIKFAESMIKVFESKLEDVERMIQKSC